MDRHSSHRLGIARRRACILAVVGALVSGGTLVAQQIDMSSVRSNDELRRGVTAFYNGYYNDSILAFEKSLEYRQDNMQAHYWLGRAYYYTGYQDAAISQWKIMQKNGAGSAYIDGLVSSVTARSGLLSETSTPQRYVISSELQGQVGDSQIYSHPTTIVPRSDGSFYLTSFGTHAVVLMDANGRRRATLRGGFEGFDGPFDVAERPDGNLYVSEYYADRISLVRPNGDKIRDFGGPQPASGDLVGPQYLALDSDGYLYVSSWGSGVVTKFDPDGKPVLTFGSAAGGFGGLRKPTGIAVTNDTVFVADAGTHSLYAFDTSGNYLATYAEGSLNQPEDVTVVRPGMLMVADTSRLLLVNTSNDTMSIVSDFEGRAKRITSAAVGANGSVFAADFDGNETFVLANIDDLFTALFVQIDRVISTDFPNVTIEATVENRAGTPIVGLDASNFRITENGLATAGTPELVFAGYRDQSPEVALLADRSKAMQKYLSQERDAAYGLYDAIHGAGDLRVVSSGRTPVVEAGTDAGKLTIGQAAVQGGTYTTDWSFDLGVRLAGSELLKARGKRAIVFVTQGHLDSASFSHYSLDSLAAYLKNNGIIFSVVTVNQDRPDDELAYLTKSTGGEITYLYNPRGVAPAVDDIRAAKNGTYVLKYRSVSNSDFGRAYIAVESEVFLLRRTGRGEAGYYGPIQY